MYRFFLKIKNIVIYLALIFFVFFFPTSQYGIQISEDSKGYIYLYYGISIVISFLYLKSNSINIKRAIWLLILFVYLLLATLISTITIRGEFNIARFVYTIIPLTLLSTDLNRSINKRVVLILLDVLLILITIWNFGLIFNIYYFTQITVDHFSQFNSYTTSVFISKNRPIFTFGVYNYCAYFYSGLFVILTAIIRNCVEIKKRYYAYLIILIIFQFLLRGSTALMFGSAMLYSFLKTLNRNKFAIMLVPIFILAGVVYIYYLDYDWNRLIVGNESHGFFSRYLGHMFSENFDAVKSTIIGIGWTVIRTKDISYTDSGFIVLFTMGSIVFPAIMYKCLYNTLILNLPDGIGLMMFVFCMMFEIALPGLLYPKAVLFIMYILITIRSACNQDRYSYQEKSIQANI